MDKPYAGVFETFLLPNNDPDLEMRLGQLAHAVKMVNTRSQRRKNNKTN